MVEITIKQKLTLKQKKFNSSMFLKWACWGASIFAVLFMVFVLAFVFVKGLPSINMQLLFGEHTSKNPSLLGPILNTFTLIFFSLLIALPIGVATAIFSTEYTNKGNKLVKVVRTAAETLAAIPSIVYALFGLIFFVRFLGWGYSLRAGICTLAIMILPAIIRATEESIVAVPDALREASFALGAGRLRTIFKIVLPQAMPGIVAAIILSIGRIVGESAALIFTAGTMFDIPSGLKNQGASLAVAMFALIERAKIDEAYGAAVVLVILVVGLNLLSTFVGKKLGGKNNGN